MKFKKLITIVAIGCLSLLIANPAFSKNVTGIRWQPVPGTLSRYDGDGHLQSQPDSIYIGTNNIVRRGNKINFSIINLNAEYLRFSGDCKTKMMDWIETGRQTGANSFSVKFVDFIEPSSRSAFKAEGGNRTILNYACSLKKRR